MKQKKGLSFSILQMYTPWLMCLIYTIYTILACFTSWSASTNQLWLCILGDWYLLCQSWLWVLGDWYLLYINVLTDRTSMFLQTTLMLQEKKQRRVEWSVKSCLPLGVSGQRIRSINRLRSVCALQGQKAVCCHCSLLQITTVYRGKGTECHTLNYFTFSNNPTEQEINLTTKVKYVKPTHYTLIPSRSGLERKLKSKYF